nr:MAG TPA: hypothetical protein [Caudoviricetes sp.]
MMTLFETMANVDFCMFLLGTFGIPFFMWVHKMLSKCNCRVFSTICVVLVYFVLTHLE